MKCNYYRKIVHSGLTRIKQHLAHVSGQVKAYLKVPKEVSTLLRKHLSKGSKERVSIKAKKEHLMKSLTKEAFHEISDTRYDDEIEEVGGLKEIEKDN